MALLDLILNLAGLLLWFGWRQSRVRVAAPLTGVSLLSTLKRADNGPRRNHLPSVLLVLLVVRAGVYWQVGSAVEWVATLPAGLFTLPFQSRFPGHMALYSFASFGMALAVAFLWLIGLSVLHPRPADNAPNRFVRTQLGFLDRWPASLRLALPFVVMGAAWAVAVPLLIWLRLLPEPQGGLHWAEQSALQGLAFYLQLRWLVAGVLLLHLVNTYVYLGAAAFWTYVQDTATTVLWPLRAVLQAPLRLSWKLTRAKWVHALGWAVSLQWGKFDLTPVAGIVLVLGLGEWAVRALVALAARLPL